MQISSKLQTIVILVAVAWVIAKPSQAQEPDYTGIFHVTKIAYADAADLCPPGKCIAKRITVDGFITKATGVTIGYEARCIGVTQLDPKNAATDVCPLLHVDEDYSVEIWGASISFSRKSGTILYSIISETEISRRKP